MKEFDSFTPDAGPASGDNPFGTFLDEGGGNPGTPLLADFINSVKALFEKLMIESGIPYDDAVDTVTSCQSWDALNELYKKYVQQFDYVIDSDEALQALCDGTATAKSVFIQSGTWTASSGSVWDLDATSTKSVEGTSDSLLSFSDITVASALFHSSSLDQSNPSEYFCRDFSVELTDSTINCFAVQYVDNLDNISVVVNQSGGYNAWAFGNCSNVNNCYAEVNQTDVQAAGGFSNCENMVNCKGNTTSTAASLSEAFNGCSKLVNCEGTSQGSVGNAFQSCTYLSNCKGTATGSSSSYAFANCNYVYAPTTDSSGGTATFNSSNGVQTNAALS